ncbi:hypothetical protein ACFOEK_14495 [Litoribrevibacter euphylliae]|uniref:CHRD domain-containing protein n=1 Tax=Litoribrevibacter euphylliae TaxID=1834034 RepID=A0ABV7HHW1_9GAMM
MKIKLLASCIASAWLVTGCGGGSGSGSDPISSSAGSATEGIAETASVNISASFPESAQAAAIDGNAEAITVAFYPSEAGSIEEAIEVVQLSAQCLKESTVSFDWECLPEDAPSLGDPALLTAGSPSVSLDLVPGKYRVEAHQFDTSTPDFETPPISSTSSFVTLTEGEHSIELNLIHATWTAGTPITLQLLNNVLQDENDEDIDLDPEVEGTQTLADLMELTDQPIIGMHLVGMPTFIEETKSLFDGEGDEGATAAFDDFPVDSEGDLEEIAMEILDYWMGESNHMPVLRQSDGGTGETVVWWWDEFDGEENDCFFDGPMSPGDGSEEPPTETPTETTEVCIERFMSPSTLLQGYQPTVGNTNILNLGELVAEYEEWSPDGPDFGVEGGLATVPFQLADPTITVANGTVTLDWGDGQNFAHVHAEEIQTPEGSEEAVFLDFETETGSTTFPDDDNRLDQVDGPTITGGTTITGTLIEFLIQFDEEHVAGTVPTVPDNITPDLLGSDPMDTIMASQAAVAAGLIAAPAATDNGTNCSTLTDNFSGVFTKFIWDDTEEAWIGGTWNHSYFLEDTNNDGIGDTVIGEDLNGDGEITQFETGVYENMICDWDEINQMEVCEDLDNVANDTTDKYETVPAGFEETGTGEYCLHTFTMTAGQLSFSFSDLLSSTDVTVQN